MVPIGKQQDKSVFCPTCRQRSDFDSIAFADDRRSGAIDRRCENFEASISVQGSYGTKVLTALPRLLVRKIVVLLLIFALELLC